MTIFVGGAIQYSGSFLKGKFQGEGIIIEVDEIYVGAFINKKRHGKGKVTFGEDGSSFASDSAIYSLRLEISFNHNIIS